MITAVNSETPSLNSRFPMAWASLSAPLALAAVLKSFSGISIICCNFGMPSRPLTPRTKVRSCCIKRVTSSFARSGITCAMTLTKCSLTTPPLTSKPVILSQWSCLSTRRVSSFMKTRSRYLTVSKSKARSKPLSIAKYAYLPAGQSLSTQPKPSSRLTSTPLGQQRVPILKPRPPKPI